MWLGSFVVLPFLVGGLSGANLDLSSSVVELTTQNFDKTSEGLWLLEFYAPWCGHCKKLAPTYEKIAAYFHEQRDKRGVHVAKIDATEHPGLASRFDIKGYPTLLLFRNDRKVADFSGPRTYENIVRWVEENEHNADGTPVAKAKATSRSESAGGRSPPGRRAPGQSMGARFRSLLTDHDPLKVGLYMMGFAGVCCTSLLVFICAVSPRPAAA